ncbi:C-C motif chemokine 5-like [Parambassis ranga]|nr:C-C motif chemokine 5-like [Parambassis ranga]XP_028285361.1 C-C motif chemokine 5-like [Parambassis ranga]XP_028285374.1 C-C motif chemokine 5-like [Parambassis ranga]XP_028285376.1 C-C motif chemokine 5-like [Parambassis ranga]XP_028285378.1 C-C motif chemokine 5-like [Parambassis ranga]XP_028285379.1 C-C motif chemokine 5-like [Parambassis ranga]XP_028285565.1 C-C motif chemokine 5-like [Parambassis ranga]
MRSAHILLLCILGAALLSTVFCNQIGPDKCCFTYYPTRIPPKHISSYYMTDDRCMRAAAVFVTTRSRHVCVDPSQGWVKDVMRILDESSFQLPGPASAPATV